MSLADRVSALATRMGSELQTLRGAQKVSLSPTGSLHAALARAAVGPVRAVMLGSSTPSGTGSSDYESRGMTAILTRSIQRAHPSAVYGWESPTVLLSSVSYAQNLPGFHMANGALGGSWSNSYAPQATMDQIDIWQPHIVFHMVGANDYRTDLVTPTQTQANITAKMAQLDTLLPHPVVHVIIGTFAAGDNATPDYPWTAYLQAMKNAAASSPRGVYIDGYTEYAEAGASGSGLTDAYGLIGTDLVHMTDAGHEMMGKLVATRMGLPTGGEYDPPEVVDRFTRKVLGSTETGHPWTSQLSGVYVPDGRYVSATTAGNIVVDPGFSDVEVSAVVTFNGGSIAGLIAKSGDASTRIGFYYSGPSNRWELYRGTSFVALGPTYPFVTGREYHLRLRVKSGAVRCYVDGELIFSHTLTVEQALEHMTYTMHGIRINSVAFGSPKFRNFSVRAIR